MADEAALKTIFGDHLRAWGLVIDGEPAETPSSWIVPVRRGADAAILKRLKPESDETVAAALLSYYDGQGAVRLFEADAKALLMERATGDRSLVTMATSGRDLEAAEVLAATFLDLHQPRGQAPPSTLWPLEHWFESLFDHQAESPLLRTCAKVAKGLLANPIDQAPLHGDLHHNNVLDGVDRGWLAIDPKALLGETAYDIANMLRNPWPYGDLVHDKERMNRLADFYAKRLDLDVGRVLAFACAHSGLSACWDLDDGLDPTYSLACAEILLSLLPE